jgi:phage protein D
MALVVTCKIKVDGQLLEPQWASKLARVTVEQRLEAADRFELSFGEGGMELFDSELFKSGTKVEVEVTAESAAPLIKGEVIAATPEFVSGKPTTLRVEGFDSAFRLSRQKRRRTFLDMTAGDIVRKIASDAGLRADTETGDKFEYLYQDNVSDMEFLVSLARRHRFEVIADDKTIRFRPPDERSDADTSFKWGEDLLQFTPKMTAARQPSQVIVRGWDPVSKKEAEGRAGVGQEEAAVGKGKRAGDVVKEGFGDAPMLVTDGQVRSAQEAEVAAKRLLSQLAMDFLQADATVPGNSAVKPGRLVEINGVGEQYEGGYYVTQVEHKLSPRGFVTRFWAKRNALHKAEPKEVKPAEVATETKDHWLEAKFVDADDNPIAMGAYVLKAPDGTEFTGEVGDDGVLHHDGLVSGDCQIAFKSPTELRWAKNPVIEGEEAILTGAVPVGVGESVTVDLFQLLREKDEQKLDSVSATVGEDERFEAKWTPPGADKVSGWTEFIACASVGDRWVNSPVLFAHPCTLRNARWSAKEARAGEKVELSADAVGFPDDTEVQISVWDYDSGSEDDKVVDLPPAKTKGEKVRTTWVVEHYEDTDAEGGHPASPEFYVVLESNVAGKDYKARSGMMTLLDWVRIEMKDPDGAPYAYEPYKLHLPDGRVREGKLDADGKALERGIPPGNVRVEFPRLSEE